MIEFEKSRSGMPIFKSEGRLFNSSYDPVSEAQRWLALICRKAMDFENVILLGVGSIYHCLAFHKMNPSKKILILEVDPELIKMSLEIFSELKQIQICQISKSDDLLVNDEVASISDGIFCTLRLPSTHISNKQIFDEIETVLTGRSSYEFARICEWRPQLRNQIDFSRLYSSDLISVKEIAGAFKQNERRLTQERRILYILEELVR